MKAHLSNHYFTVSKPVDLEYNDEKFFVRQVLSGNRNAFEQLVRQYEGLVLHIVTPLIGVSADREDICQDVFIKVYEKLNTFQFKSKLSTWIGNIAYNTSMNFLQKKKNILVGDLFPKSNELNETIFFEQISNGATISPEDILITKDDVDVLVAAIDKLPSLQKAVLLLFHQDDLSLDEIGNIMEMPVNTVKSHLFRARKSLKEILTK